VSPRLRATTSASAGQTATSVVTKAVIGRKNFKKRVLTMSSTSPNVKTSKEPANETASWRKFHQGPTLLTDPRSVSSYRRTNNQNDASEACPYASKASTKLVLHTYTYGHAALVMLGRLSGECV